MVPAPPGGVTDVLARTLGKHFNQDWGATPVVENRGGANNQLAAEYVMHQPADGYTLMIGPEVTFTANPALFPNLRYSLKDFTPISGLATIYHGAHRQSVGAGQFRERSDRDRQDQTRLAQLRHIRRRLDRAPQHGAARVR